MRIFLIDVKGESGVLYGLHFECETWDQAREMVRDTGLNGIVAGKLIASMELQEDETDLNIKPN